MDIFDHLKETEKNSIITNNYFALQKDISEKMRSILVDWLIDLSEEFKSKGETYRHFKK